MALTWQDYEILESLAFKVRVYTLDQCAKTWFSSSPDPIRMAKSKVEELVGLGLLHSFQRTAYPILTLKRPVFTWRPGDGLPSYRDVANSLQSRWTKTPVIQQLLIPTRKAVRHIGGRGRPKPPLMGQDSHDIHLSEVYLHFLAEQPERASRWYGEEFFREDREGEKLPDAMLLHEDYTPYFVIEFGGSYDHRRVREFHEDCEERELPYELW